MPSYVLYTPVLRSAHLERLAPLAGFRVLAGSRHPDCDDSLLRAAPFPVRVAGLDALEADLRERPPAVLEITEPLWRAEWPASVRLAAAVPAAVVTAYAIEVLPDRDPPAVDRLDAVAFGSSAAQDAYAVSCPAARWSSQVLPERLGRCLRCFGSDEPAAPAAREVVFAAEFSERKGIDLLMGAWDLARPQGWRLRLLGWGPRLVGVQAWGAGRPDVDVVAGADRTQVHDALRRAAVVVLPSRRVPGWREQVGLSLVEGLAHGCRLLTTDQTGLADDLRRQGHLVVAPDDPEVLAVALGAATDLGPVKQLPPRGQDSRRQVQAWFAGLAGATTA